jgi:hypothetical protein
MMGFWKFKRKTGPKEATVADVTRAVGLVRKSMSFSVDNVMKDHLATMKRARKYVKGTSDRNASEALGRAERIVEKHQRGEISTHSAATMLMEHTKRLKLLMGEKI